MKMRNGGFTFIELVMVIVILSIIAAVAIPKFFDFTQSSRAQAEEAWVEAVRVGISNYFVRNNAYPPSLDDAATGSRCSKTNRLFTTILTRTDGCGDAHWWKSWGSFGGSKRDVYFFMDSPEDTYSADNTAYMYIAEKGDFKCSHNCP